MEGFMVTCPLAPSVPHLLSSSCSSPRAFGLGFLQTPPRDDALALFLAFGSANTWRKDFHLTSSVPCPAHTARHEPRGVPRRLHAVVRRLIPAALTTKLDSLSCPTAYLWRRRKNPPSSFQCSLDLLVFIVVEVRRGRRRG